MISLKRCQFLIGLVVVLFCLPALCQSKQFETELRFEISREQQQWVIQKGKIGEGPIKLTHVAVLFVRQPQYMPNFTQPTAIKQLLSTASGRSISQKQRDFISTGQSFCLLGGIGDTVPNHYHFRLYAVSELDARNMAQAFIEDLTKRANAKRERLLIEQQEFQRQIAECQDNISAKEAELKALQTKLAALKGKVHYLSSDEAKETVLELNKMLDSLDVEIAGLQAKVSAIEKYKSDKKITNEDTLAKLEQMLSEQAVELAGALARKEAATRIRDQAGEFYNLEMQRLRLPRTLSNLKSRLSNRESLLHDLEEKLANPPADMLPPRVFQDKVTIYPVRIE